MLTKEQREVFKKWGGMIKKEFGGKAYLRYRMITYYFNETITDERGEKLYNILKNKENFFVMLLNYRRDGTSYYKFIQNMVTFANMPITAEREYYLKTSDFFKYFNI